MTRIKKPTRAQIAREKLAEMVTESLSAERHGISDAIVLHAREREDASPRWRMYRGWWRIYRSHAFNQRECGSCGNCRHYMFRNEYEGECQLTFAGVRIGDWCGQCDFVPPKPGTYDADEYWREPNWKWPSRTWTDNLGTKRCRSCINCAYSVRLNHFALCRLQAPKQGLFGPVWPIIERTAEVCEHAIFSRPKHWPFN